MKTMKVVKAFGPQDLRVVEAPVPTPGAGWVRVKVRASGICGSDKWVWDVAHEVDSIAGHEIAGEVEMLGAGVTSLVVGDRVMINNVGGCGGCQACRAGAFVLCPDRSVAQDVNNGFGEYVIAPAQNCMRLLPGIDFVDGALIPDNWGTPYGGLLRADIQAGMDVLVVGCGPIGQAAIALCRAVGAYVIAVDPVKFRREAALASGADKAFVPNDLPRAVQLATNGLGVHTVLECSGFGAAYETALESLRIGGSLVAIGEHANFEFRSSDHVIRRALSIVGSWYSTLPQAGEIMQLALSKRINLKSFLTHTITLEEVPKIFKSIMECEDGILKCVIVFD